MVNDKCLLLRPSPRQPSVILLNRFAISFRRGAFVAESQICSSGLLLRLPAQLQLELTQRFDYVRLEGRRCLRIAFHAAIGTTVKLFNHLVEPSCPTARTPVVAQALGVAQPFAQLSTELAIITAATVRK